jgi:ADP-ribose pyrophosphatase
MPVKILSSEIIFDRPWLPVRKEKLELPNGRIIEDFYVLDYADWVTVVPVTKTGNIVFIKQYRHGVQQVITELPAGVIEKGEAPLAAAQREVQEETGFSFEKFIYLGKNSPNPSVNSNYNHMVLAIGGEKTSQQKLDETEEIEPFEVTIAEAKEMLLQNKLLQSLHTSTLFFALQHLKQL